MKPPGQPGELTAHTTGSVGAAVQVAGLISCTLATTSRARSADNEAMPLETARLRGLIRAMRLDLVNAPLPIHRRRAQWNQIIDLEERLRIHIAEIARA
jgi:hypothetical protein